MIYSACAGMFTNLKNHLLTEFLRFFRDSEAYCCRVSVRRTISWLSWHLTLQTGCRRKKLGPSVMRTIKRAAVHPACSSWFPCKNQPLSTGFQENSLTGDGPGSGENRPRRLHEDIVAYVLRYHCHRERFRTRYAERTHLPLRVSGPI